MEPKLRIKGFSGKWQKKNIGDILKFKNGLNKDKNAFGFGTPIINYTDVYHYRGLTKEKIKGLVNLEYDELRRYRVKKGDVFFTRTSETPEEVGFASVLLDEIEDCSFSGFVLRGRPFTDDLSIEFCKECFSVKSVRDAIISTSTCTTRALTNGTLLSKISVSFPSKDEQNIIASFFASIDSIISACTSRITALNQMKAASLQAMFPQESEISPKVRFKGFEDDWKKESLGNLFSERIENNVDGEMLSVTMNSGIIKAADNGRFDNSNSDKSKYKVVKVGDIAYNSMRMWQGASGCSQYEGIVSPAYTVVVPNENIDSTFFAFLFKTTPMIHLFRLHSQGLTKDTWNLKYPAFSLIEVLYPESIQEQKKIADFFTTLDKQIYLHTKRLERIKQIKSACLDKMFV